MPASEKKRLALLNRLIDVLGKEEAEALMDSLPPVDWHQLATKDDFFVLKSDIFALKSDIEANKAAIEANKAAIEANKAAIEASEQRLRTEMHAGFANIRTETAAEFKMLRAENKEFQGAITLQLARQTRTMVFTMLGLAMPTWGAILAVGLS